MKCMHVFAAQKAYLLFTKLEIKPDFPSLADEIAEPHPDMTIKVAAFTVSKKSSTMIMMLKHRQWFLTQKQALTTAESWAKICYQ